MFPHLEKTTLVPEEKLVLHLVEARDLALAAKLPSTAIAMEAVILLMIAELDRRPSRYSLRLSSLVAC